MARDQIDERDDRDGFDDRDDREGGNTATAEPETDPFAPPSEAAFWHTYSSRFECPIAYVASALIIALGLLVVSWLFYISLKNDNYKPPVQIGLAGGDDDFGEGEEGGGGEINPLVLGQNSPTRDEMKNILPDLDTTLPQVKDDLLKKIQLEDQTAVIPLNDQKATSYAALDQKLRDKMLGIGSQQGDGGPGKKGEGNNPNGAGTGTGSDSTRARTLRWIIRFKTGGGRDYLDQLQSLGAKVLVPLADGKEAYIFNNLNGDPPVGKLMTEKDWNELSGLVQFSDYTRLSCEQVGQALGMGRLPKGFWAFFPKTIEQELARKEIGYQQRRSEDIEETTFEVVNRGGKYELIVTNQKLKK